MPFIEDRHEFTQRQNCERVRIPENGLRIDGNDIQGEIFENGALITAFGDLYDPPTEPKEALGMRMAFYHAKLKRAERNFNECKQDIFDSAQYLRLGAGAGPSPEAHAALERYHAEVLQLRATLAEMQAQLQKLRGNQPSPVDAYMERREEERAAAKEAIHRANSLFI